MSSSTRRVLEALGLALAEGEIEELRQAPDFIPSSGNGNGSGPRLHPPSSVTLGSGESLEPVEDVKEEIGSETIPIDIEDLLEAQRAERLSADGSEDGEGGSFFDLAAELKKELREELEDPSWLLLEPVEEGNEDEQKGGLRSVFDQTTHLNLGIAYREMGMLDEAIGELQLAAKGPHHFVECSSLLGRCLVEMGLPDQAVMWFRRGLEAETITPGERLGLLYELGQAHLVLDQPKQAFQAFAEIYRVRPDFRDVVQHIDSLVQSAQSVEARSAAPSELSYVSTDKRGSSRLPADEDRTDWSG